MSLRYQISLRVLLFSVVIIILGGWVTIWQARNAVDDEVESSINLALQLINLGLSGRPGDNSDESDWIYRLSALKQTRHLRIQLKEPSGEVVDISGGRRAPLRRDLPPSWFVKLVRGEYPKAEHRVMTADGKQLTLIVQANPLDEITEVWQEAAAFFTTICSLVLLTFLALHLVFNKALRAIDVIVDTVKLIETGEYGRKLPDFSTREYDSIARAINHMTDVLDKTRRQNQALTQHSLQIQEEERLRLSQELHDEMGQSLTAIKVMAATAAYREADTSKITRSIIDICDHLMIVVRSMMRQLHPLMLTELGIKATLEDLVNHWQERNPKLVVTLECEDAVDMLDKTITIQIFRVIQECLTNINRHADADRVMIKLATDVENNVRLQVADNGLGCNIGDVASGFGLLGMQERIKSLGGEFSMQSNPGEGMTISATIPIR